MSRRLEHGMMLLEMDRYAEAERELRGALAEDPDEPMAHAFLGLCLAHLERYDEATREAKVAVGQDPEEPLVHQVLARVMVERNHFLEAQRAIDEAISLDPYNEENYGVLAAIHLAQGNWQQTLDAAEEGLDLDPENAGLINLRVIALRQLGRADEAEDDLDDVLAEDPDDPWAHTNVGWNALERGDPDAALAAFSEALRLDPELDYAREGLIQALKARYRFYRLVLRYYLWMSKLSAWRQWALIIGLYVGVRMLRGMMRDNPALAPVGTLVMVLYAGFCWTTWTADILFNLLLFLHPVGRYALTREERITSIVTGALMVSGPALLVAGYVIESALLIMGGAGLLLATLLVAATAQCERGWPRTVMLLFSAAMIALAGWAMALMAGGQVERSMTMGIYYLLGVGLGGTILSNILGRYTPRL